MNKEERKKLQDYLNYLQDTYEITNKEFSKLTGQVDDNWRKQNMEYANRPSNIRKAGPEYAAIDAENAQRSAERIQGLRNEENALRAKIHSNRKKKDRSLFGKAKVIFGKPKHFIFNYKDGHSYKMRGN